MHQAHVSELVAPWTSMNLLKRNTDLVPDTAEGLVLGIGVAFLEAPLCKGVGVAVSRKEAVSSYEGDGVGKNCPWMTGKLALGELADGQQSDAEGLRDTVYPGQRPDPSMLGLDSSAKRKRKRRVRCGLIAAAVGLNFGLLTEEAGVELNIVGMSVKFLESLGDLRVAVVICKVPKSEFRYE